MDKKLNLLDSFTARDTDGATHKVRVYEHQAAVALLGDAGTASWEPTGVVEYKLEDGRPVSVAADGAMTVASSGLRLEKV